MSSHFKINIQIQLKIEHSKNILCYILFYFILTKLCYILCFRLLFNHFQANKEIFNETILFQTIFFTSEVVAYESCKINWILDGYIILQGKRNDNFILRFNLYSGYWPNFRNDQISFATYQNSDLTWKYERKNIGYQNNRSFNYVC